MNKKEAGKAASSSCSVVNYEFFVQVAVTVTSRPDGSLNELRDVVFVLLTLVTTVGFVEAVAFVLVITASVQVMLLPVQPGEVLTL